MSSFTELDNLMWNTTAPGTIYTMSMPTDYDPEKHPSVNGCVEVLRYGTGSTLQRFTSGDSGFFIRRFLTGSNKWTAWERV